MKKALLLLLSVILCGCAVLYKNPNHTYASGTYKSTFNKNGIIAIVGNDEVANKYINFVSGAISGDFNIVERKKLDIILEEYKFQLSGLSADKQKYKAAEISGADYVGLLSITRQSSYTGMFNIINVKTGIIEASGYCTSAVEEIAAKGAVEGFYCRFYPDDQICKKDRRLGLLK